MVFTHPNTQNWSRAFTVWISDIQVVFPSQAVARVIRGGFLRRVRSATRAIAAVSSVMFSLHCTRPEVQLPAGKVVRTGASRPVASHFLTVTKGAEPAFEETGLASWYGDGDGFEEMATASGEPLRSDLATCAHRTLPFGTLIEVENLENGRRTLARVNDRGPFVKGRVLDMSVRAARDLGLRGRGVVNVRLHSAVPEGLPLAMTPVITEAMTPPELPAALEETPVALALDASSRIEVPLLRFVADTFWWLLGTVPSENGTPKPDGRMHGRPPFLHREAY